MKSEEFFNFSTLIIGVLMKEKNEADDQRLSDGHTLPI